MNHPTPEDWMSYLYDEVGAVERAGLTAHLRSCPSCAAQLGHWRDTTRNLDAWPLRARETHPRRLFARPFVQWAAAAMILLGAGFAAGKLVSAAADGRRLRAEIEPVIRQQLRQEFEAKRIEDNRAIYAALEKLDAQRIAGYVSLKKELDTVAVLTDAGLRNTEQRLAQLVDYTQSTTFPSSPQK